MNPHPSKSKPVKIGRKHTGAPSLRAKGRRASSAIKHHRNQINKYRKYKARVAAFWRGELETYPRASSLTKKAEPQPCKPWLDRQNNMKTQTNHKTKTGSGCWLQRIVRRPAMVLGWHLYILYRILTPIERQRPKTLTQLQDLAKGKCL